MPNNLQGTTFAQEFPLDNIRPLIDSAKSAYDLSIPLLIAAQLGNNQLYKSARDKIKWQMQSLAQDTKNDSLRAWLYGRIAMAADCMDDIAERDEAVKTLTTLLLWTPTIVHDHRKAWAFGYFASIDQTYLLSAKNHTDVITQVFHGKNREGYTRSDICWAWVMFAQAAAKANNKSMYDHAINQMMTMTHTKLIEDALDCGIPPADFKRWATSILYAAGSQMEDPRVEPLKKSLELVTKEDTLFDPNVMLAQTTYQLELKRQAANSFTSNCTIQ
jgi:hypothetical protein